MQGQPVDRPAPAPTPAKDLTRGGSFPLSAVTSVRLLRVTFAPRIIYGQGQDTRAHSNWPGPGPPRTTNKVTGTLFGAELLSTFFAVVAGFAIHPEDLRRGATPELLDDIAANVMALRLGDEQFAREIYRDIRDQAIRAAERWYDVAVRVRLS